MVKVNKETRTGITITRHICSCHDALHSPDSNTPAFKSKLETSYWQHGKLHREAGPAYYYTNHLYDPPRIKKEYHINGRWLSKTEFIRRYEFIYMKPYTGE